MNGEQKTLLTKPIADLPLNKDLVELLQFHGYDSLEKVLKRGIAFHRKNSGLTIHDELELFRFVKENGLYEFWKSGL
ncbi:MAG TPA: hypothetical protein VHD35_03730 [Chitinophagaceae bacterium]|nr:hypothetical protein [Chitinophagaceae bacterium]